jgi:phage baseplate assembly protein W
MTQLPGRDLRVLLGPPGLRAHDAASLDLHRSPRPSQQPRRRRSVRHEAAEDPTAPQGWSREPAGAREVHDLAVISGRESLAQALVLRLLTPLGSLAPLGHSTYGSRLGELVGRRKTESLRGLCRAYVLQALLHEPRIEHPPLAVTFDRAVETPSSFAFEIVVRPAEVGDAFAVGMEVAL